MALEQRPATSRIPETAWQERFRRHVRDVDDAYLYLADPHIDPLRPEQTLEEIFGSAVVAEAQIAQVVTTSLGRGITELAAHGVPLEQTAAIQLPRDYSDMLAGFAAGVHDLFGVPEIPKESLSETLRTITFPVVGISSAVNAIASLEDGRRVPHTRGIVDIQDAPPPLSDPRSDSLVVAQRFLAGGPQNVEIARTAFKVAHLTLLEHRSQRDAYHAGFVAPQIVGLRPTERRAAYMDVRAGFGGSMIDKLTDALTPQTVPGARPDQLNVFANNITAYVKLPR